MTKNILFVCTGNTCRSIMAQALFQQLVSNQGELSRMEIHSAGLAAYPGDGASEHARQVLKEEGVKVDDHRARTLSPKMVEEADLVLTMTRRHKETILALMPQAEG
ncbi:MAG: low molecular weight protein arginine phosphatase, partial [Candidatus Contubernalis sp.]|nr:low molecular weight protein arginine phosphatase [Candidatus Contubernalis sp.]